MAWDDGGTEPTFAAVKSLAGDWRPIRLPDCERRILEGRLSLDPLSEPPALNFQAAFACSPATNRVLMPSALLLINRPGWRGAWLGVSGDAGLAGSPSKENLELEQTAGSAWLFRVEGL